MSVIRINKTQNFTVMSNYHFKEKGMSLKAKGLLSLMLSLPDDWDYSISGLVTLSKDGKDSVMSALSELEKFGYLLRKRLTNSKGQFSGVEYNIFEQPQPENPIAENQNSEKQNAEKSNAGKPSQLNTNKIKDLNNKELKELNTKEFDEILVRVSNESLKKLYKEYIEMRESINAPLTPKGLNMLIDRVERISGFKLSLQKELLESAIINNWKNVYNKNDEPKEDEAINRLKSFYE